MQVGAANDPLEREADEVSRAVVAALGGAASAPVRVVDAMDAGRIRRAAPVGLRGGAMSESDSRELAAERHGGRPIPDVQRESLEAAFGGADFSGVRVHTGAATDRIAGRISARAFTTGSDVFIRSSDHRPNTAEGTRLLAHELTHTIQQGGSPVRRSPGRRIARRTPVVQRAPIARANILTMFKGITGLKDLFSDDAANAGPQGLSVVDQAHRMMINYEVLFEAAAPSDVAANAMKLAAAARVMGGMLARQLNNPWSAPELSTQLLNYYRHGLRARLKTAGVGAADIASTMNLAQVISSADPVKMFMTDKISADDATRKIQEMAAAANCTAVQMHQYLVQQFQMELGSFTTDEIAAGTIGEGVAQDQSPVTGEAELIGELSSKQFRTLVNTAVRASGRRWAAINGAGDGLDFTVPSALKLAQLQQQVAAAAPVVAPVVPTNLGAGAAGLSDRQKLELGSIRDADEAVARGGIESEVIAALRAEFGTDSGGAARLLTMFLDAFRTMPLTTTFGAANMFAGGVPNDLDYQNAMKRELANVKLKDLFPRRQDGKTAAGSVAKIGQDHGMAEHRGNKNYVRWRYEKDVKPAGYGGLDIGEVFEFGAISPTFAAAKGSEYANTFGSNQYGDSHVVYRPEVKDRAVYQFTAKGPIRRDPLLLLHDIAVGAPAAKAAAVAAKQVADQTFNNAVGKPAKDAAWAAVGVAQAALTTATSKETQGSNVVKAIFSSIASKKLAFLDQQQIEVRIFGRVNFATDTSELHIGPAMSQQVKDNAKAFALAKGIKFSIVAPGSATLRVDGAAVPAAELNTEVQKLLTKGSDRKAHAFDALAHIVMNIRTIAAADALLLQALVAEVTAIFNSLGKTRTAARAARLVQVQNHAPAIV